MKRIILIVVFLSGYMSAQAQNKENGHDYVDLGLSVMWATCNVGATSSSGRGEHYAWGETTTKGEYSKATYKYYDARRKSITKYCAVAGTGRVHLDSSDDVAHIKWGGRWRIPTYEEILELLHACNWKYTKINGVNGYLITSRMIDHFEDSIFLPATGCYLDKDFINQDAKLYYWSSTLYGDDEYNSEGAWYLNSTPETPSANAIYYRYCGFAVRPVFDITE